jgi:hypothetical protein
MSSHGVGADGQREGMRLGEKEEKEQRAVRGEWLRPVDASA